MAGFIAAPGQPGRIGLGNGELLTVDSKTGVRLSVGAGLVGRTDKAGRRLLLDAQRGESPETATLFRPGMLTDGLVIGQVTNTRAAGRARLTLVEINLGSAPPAGTDAANCYAVRVRGAAGTELVQVALSDPTRKFYSFDAASPASLAKVATATTTFDGDGRTGVAQLVRPTADLDIIAFDLAVRFDLGRQHQGFILDGQTRQTLGASYVQVGDGSNINNRYVLPLQQRLLQGVDYWLACNVLGAKPNSTPAASGVGFSSDTGYPQPSGQLGVLSGAGFVSGFVQAAQQTVSNFLTCGGGQVFPVDWTKPIDVSGGFEFNGPIGFQNRGGATLRPEIFGTAQGVVLPGQLTVDIVKIGAPLAAPADLTVRTITASTAL